MQLPWLIQVVGPDNSKVGHDCSQWVNENVYSKEIAHRGR
jgi:hypothetical protein